MSRKNNLLSIGDLSKLTGVGIKSLRYYERINILIPAYISPDSGYRYYTLDQTNIVEIIQFCIELDIPLSELKQFITPDGTMNYKDFIAKGRSVAEIKLAALKKGLNLISTIENQMALTEQYKIGEVYTREIPEKYFYVKPCGDSLKNLDRLDIIKSFYDLPYTEDDNEMWEFGFMCEVFDDKCMYYAFAEMPRTFEGTKTIPKGMYICRQYEESMLEAASEGMRANSKGEGYYIAIETEIFTSKSNVNKPINELRLIWMTSP